MLKSKEKFVFTGGSGRFGQVIQKKLKKKKFFFSFEESTKYFKSKFNQ